jgi:hypothetical protein
MARPGRVGAPRKPDATCRAGNIISSGFEEPDGFLGSKVAVGLLLFCLFPHPARLRVVGEGDIACIGFIVPNN